MAQSRSDQTKQDLIRAAFVNFAEKGFAATSTREIAAAAKTNIASINYHFGGKSGLRMACANAIVEQLYLLRSSAEPISLPKELQEFETVFETAILHQAYIILALKESEPMIRFMLREAHEKGEVFDYVFENFFRPSFSILKGSMNASVKQAGGSIPEDLLKLTVFSVISQIAYFRIAEPLVLRVMNWSEYGENETTQILKVLQSNIRAILGAHTNKNRSEA